MAVSRHLRRRMARARGHDLQGIELGILRDDEAGSHLYQERNDDRTQGGAAHADEAGDDRPRVRAGGFIRQAQVSSCAGESGPPARRTENTTETMKAKVATPPIERQRDALNLYEGDAYYVERRDSLHGDVFAVIRRSSGEAVALYDVPWEASDAALKLERESNQQSLF